MSFDFQVFIDKLREDEEKKEVVEKYEKHFGTIKGGVKDQVWYKDYASKFKPHSYNVPEELEDDFDWDLFCQLLASSISTSSSLKRKEGKTELLINSNPESSAVISKLRREQIFQLYGVYCAEQIGLQILMKEDEKGKKALLAERKNTLSKWQKELKSIPIKQYIDAIESEIIVALD